MCTKFHAAWHSNGVCDYHLLSGVTAMLAAYIVFDVCMSPSLQNTILFVESKILGKVSAAVQLTATEQYNVCCSRQS